MLGVYSECYMLHSLYRLTHEVLFIIFKAYKLPGLSSSSSG